MKNKHERVYKHTNNNTKIASQPFIPPKYNNTKTTQHKEQSLNKDTNDMSKGDYSEELSLILDLIPIIGEAKAIVETAQKIAKEDYAGAVYSAATIVPYGKLLKINKLRKLAKRTNVKFINFRRRLPSVKKIKVDMKHIMSNHTLEGTGVKAGKKGDIFPSSLHDKKAIEGCIKRAYKSVSKIQKKQEERLLLKGFDPVYKIDIEMWLNTRTKTIETAYPKF